MQMNIMFCGYGKRTCWGSRYNVYSTLPLPLAALVALARPVLRDIGTSCTMRIVTIGNPLFDNGSSVT